MFLAKATGFKDGDRRLSSPASRGGVFFRTGPTTPTAILPACRGPALRGILVNKWWTDRCRPHLRRPDLHRPIALVCPWHGYEYDIKTGECAGDRKLKLRKYEWCGAVTTFSSWSSACF